MSTTTKRRVHFHPEDTVIEIESHKDYTKKEIQASWYTASQRNKLSVKRCRVAMQWEADSESTFCIRGLEQYTEKGALRTEKSIRMCIDAVMDEQDAQWLKGEDDFDRFAVLSQEVSKFCVALARLRAEEDAISAKRIYKRMEKHQKHSKSKKRPSKKSASKPASNTAIEVDDHTSVCSDLSHPEVDSELSTEHSEDDLVFEQVQILATNKVRDNKGSESLAARRIKVKALKTKITEISQALKTIYAL